MKVVRSLENRPAKVIEALTEVLNSGAYAEGKYTQRVEAFLSALFGKPTTTMNSCGSALYTAFTYLKNCGYTEALVQNNTFYASGAMALEAGLAVTLVDSKSSISPSMGLKSLRAAYKETSGRCFVVLTHVGGWLADDYQEIAEFCMMKNLPLVEDCAHAVGLPMAGTLGDIACWSFYPTKAVPCGEGGALSSSDQAMMEFATLFKQYGKYRKDGTIMYGRGMNLRMSEWDAAVLSVQLDDLSKIIGLRRADARALAELVPCMLEGPSNYYKYPVARKDAVGLKTVGPVYQRSDQLDVCLAGAYGLTTRVPLDNSHAWAEAHVCLPCGEGLFSWRSPGQVRKMLEA